VAGYLFSAGARNAGDLDSIAKTGGISVTRTVTNAEKDPSGDPPKEGRTVTGGVFDQNVTVHPKNEDPPERSEIPSETHASPENTASAHRKGRKNKNGSKQPPAGTVVETTCRAIPPFDTDASYRPFASDPWIARMVVMYNDESQGSCISDESVPVRLASRWYYERESEAAMRKRIEPLLLTGIDMDVITLDLIGIQSARPAIEAYERLFYNCRIDDWSLNPSMQLIQRMAMPYGPLKTFMRKNEELDSDGFVIGDGRPLAKDSDVWRAIAATMGYDALIYYWRWDGKAHGMTDRSLEHAMDLGWKAATGRLLSDLFTGDMRHEDAARILSAYTAQSKKLTEDRRGSGEVGADDTVNALMGILSLTAPEMVAVDTDERTMLERSAEIKSRISSQLAIDRQSIEDRGREINAEVIDSQIAGAIGKDV